MVARWHLAKAISSIKERIVGRDKKFRDGAGGDGNNVCLHPLLHKSSNQKTSKINTPTSAVNNTVNKIILDRKSCEKL